jgi:hypothetical protein
MEIPEIVCVHARMACRCENTLAGIVGRFRAGPDALLRVTKHDSSDMMLVNGAAPHRWHACALVKLVYGERTTEQSSQSSAQISEEALGRTVILLRN